MNKRTPHREDLALVLALLRSHQLFQRAIGPVFRSAGLTSSQWDVLETLHTKGPLSINDLMRSILSTSGSLDVVIKNLIHSGLVEKTPDESDRRSRVVALTGAGTAKVSGFMLDHNQALAQIFGPLTISEKRACIRVLNKLRRKLPQPKKD